MLNHERMLDDLIVQIDQEEEDKLDHGSACASVRRSPSIIERRGTIPSVLISLGTEVLSGYMNYENSMTAEKVRDGLTLAPRRYFSA